MSPSPTLEQRRAKHVWDVVQGAKASRSAKDFAREAKRLPVRIMTSGLGHALAFLVAKGKAPDLISALDRWVLEERRGGGGAARRSSSDDLIKRIIEGDADFLRWATDETLAYLQWLNRFAEAEIGTDDTDGRD